MLDVWGREEKMKTRGDSQFFVKLWLDESIRTMAEVKGAFKLLFWYVGRITVEYATESGIRCGGVHGLSPISDRDIAGAIAGIGAPCSGDKVYKWRRTLERGGYVAWKRTPVGQRTFVIGSEKFPDDRLERLPSWATDIIDKAILIRGERSAKTAERDTQYRATNGQLATQSRNPNCQNGGAFRQNGGAFRQNGGFNIRKEVETECETEVDDTQGNACSVSIGGSEWPTPDEERERVREYVLEAIERGQGGAELAESVRYFMREPLLSPSEEDRRKAQMIFWGLDRVSKSRDFVEGALELCHPDLASAVRERLWGQGVGGVK